jgi:hypothetical protein
MRIAASPGAGPTQKTGDDAPGPESSTAIFFRNLLALNALARNPAYLNALSSYLDDAWTQARDPHTGFLTGGGIGKYGAHELLDQSAFVQMYALLARPTEVQSVA